MILDKWLEGSKQYKEADKKIDDVTHCLVVSVIHDKIKHMKDVRVRTRWQYEDDYITVTLTFTNSSNYNIEMYSKFKIPHDIINCAAINEHFLQTSIDTMQTMDYYNQDVYTELERVTYYFNNRKG